MRGLSGVRAHCIIMVIVIIAASGVCSNSAFSDNICGFPQPSICETNVDSEGIAAVTGRTLDDYCEDAMKNAKKRAVEEVLGVMINAETKLVNEVLLESITSKDVSGFVPCASVKKEWVDYEYDTYHVQIKARVDEQAVKDDIPSITPDDTVIVKISESNMGNEISSSYVESAVISALVEERYYVIDIDTAEDIKDAEIKMAADRGEAVDLRNLGLRFMSEIVMVGEVTTEEGQDMAATTGAELRNIRYSAHARLRLKAVEQDNARILCNLDVTEKGFGPTYEDAGKRAIRNLAGVAPSIVLEKCTQTKIEDSRFIDVYVKGLPDNSALRILKTELEGMRDVEQVEVGGLSPVSTKFSILYSGKSATIVFKLELTKKYKVKSYSENQITVEKLGK